MRTRQPQLCAGPPPASRAGTGSWGLWITLLAVVLVVAGCGGGAEKPSARRFTEGLLLDMQERAFERLYDKLSRERRREFSQEEYVRRNTAGFDKLDSMGGYLADWRFDDAASAIEDDSATVAVLARVTFPAKAGASEHRRKLVFSLSREDGDWRFDGMTSQRLP